RKSILYYDYDQINNKIQINNKNVLKKAAVRLESWLKDLTLEFKRKKEQEKKIEIELKLKLEEVFFSELKKRGTDITYLKDFKYNSTNTLAKNCQQYKNFARNKKRNLKRNY